MTTPTGQGDDAVAGRVRDLVRAGALIAAEIDRLTADHPGITTEWGADLIADERNRQQEREGFTTEHDAEHADESLALAACCYALPPQMRKWTPAAGGGVVPTLWPWSASWWKPGAR